MTQARHGRTSGSRHTHRSAAAFRSITRRQRLVVMLAVVSTGLAVAFWLPTRNDSASANENGYGSSRSHNRDRRHFWNNWGQDDQQDPSESPSDSPCVTPSEDPSDEQPSDEQASDEQANDQQGDEQADDEQSDDPNGEQSDSPSDEQSASPCETPSEEPSETPSDSPTSAAPTSAAPTSEPPSSEPPSSTPPTSQAPTTAPTTPPTTAPAKKKWAAFTDYSAGQIVTYKGKDYEVLAAHTSLPGWEPPNVPLLFKLVK